MILSKLFKDLLGVSNSKKIKPLYSIIQKVNDFALEMAALTDLELSDKTKYFREKLANGSTLDDLLPEAFAVVREASQRVLKMRHFDVQIMGGLALHQGRIAEMKTGEGKTLVATLPAYLNALNGKGVHIITVNEYLAKRDSEWMSPLYRFLGLSVGVILNNQSPLQKRQAYYSDITYGTNNEFGFDYLRDNMVLHPDELMQRELAYAIVDEVDSILIDEARTPLIISGQIEGSVQEYQRCYQVGLQLAKDTDYEADEKQKNIVLTEDGIKKSEKLLKIESLYDLKNMDLAHMLLQSLKAKEHFRKDVDYLVKDGEIIIVDEFTGRLMNGRRYSDGLHQAIEAKEKVQVKEENQTLASITFQNYFRMYEKLAGMTGTALTEEEEFMKIYNLDVLEIPTDKPCVRLDKNDIIYKTRQAKYQAVIDHIVELHKKGTPVLVGTISIETSEYLGQMLSRHGVVHHVLNAKYHEKEAEIIRSAGQKGAVTIATNMAGRGTDIVLGEGVQNIGGLHIIGTERHESRRIDNQLRGRAGRQGDPGLSKFFVSLEDDLMRLFGSGRISSIMSALGMPEDLPIEHRFISRSLEKAQHKVEQYYFGIRKQVLQYDDVMNRQRKTLYSLRRGVLLGEEIKQRFEEVQNFVIKEIQETPLQEQEAFLKSLLGAESLELLPYGNNLPPEEFPQILLQAIEKKRASLGEQLFEEIFRLVLMKNIDTKWIDHLYNLDLLREGIGLRSYGQRDPLLEYKVEGFAMFQEMLDLIYQETLSNMLQVQVELASADQQIKEEVLLPQPAFRNVRFQASEPSPQKELPVHSSEKIGRNDPCPCGSGKKYKKCHGANS